MAATAVQNPTKGSVDFDLALKRFAGEVLAEFQNKNIMLPLHRVKTMEPGAKSVQFPALGSTDASYHVPGADILRDGTYLKTFAQGEQLIFADREALAPVFLDNVEQRISHWRNRQEYAKKLGHALAKQVDQMVMRTINIAANKSAGSVYTGSPSGFVNVPATSPFVTAADIIEFLLDAQEQMDIKNVTMEDRYCALSPSNMRTLVNSAEGKAYIDRDYEAENGSLAHTIIGVIAGFKLLKVTHLPTDNYTATDNKLVAAGDGNSYVTNMTKVKALCWQREAVGTAVASDISLESEYKIELRGDLLVASYQMGHGTLRPECAAAASIV